MTPSPLVWLVLALASFRLMRLVGWDDVPPIPRFRNWVIGAKVVQTGTVNSTMGVTNESPQVILRVKRNRLAHFLGCSYCAGFWICVLVYVSWLAWPSGTMYAAVPLSLSSVVGAFARNLDP